MATATGSQQTPRGQSFFDEFVGETDGSVQTLISFSAPAAVNRKLHRLVVSCSVGGEFVIKEGANIIGSGRTSPAEHNAVFVWSPIRAVASETTIKVEYTKHNWVPNSDIEVYLMAEDF